MITKFDSIILEYSGLLDKNKAIQEGQVISYSATTQNTDENGIPTDFDDDGIFSTYYVLAHNKRDAEPIYENIAKVISSILKEN